MQSKTNGKIDAYEWFICKGGSAAIPKKARMKEKLVLDAFNLAYEREHPQVGLVVHTDQ